MTVNRVQRGSSGKVSSRQTRDARPKRRKSDDKAFICFIGCSRYKIFFLQFTQLFLEQGQHDKYEEKIRKPHPTLERDGDFSFKTFI